MRLGFKGFPLGFRDGMGIPGMQVWNSGIREGFLASEMLFPLLSRCFPSPFSQFFFSPRAAMEWVVLEALPRNPWDSLIHPKIPGM